ncbi:MAG: amino acid adenylation domain-containing protein, partial [Candidatus Scalindua sp.]|nr:amino acid adenylation domain-containing protein [Candidatus Scalindua sp.]
MKTEKKARFKIDERKSVNEILLTLAELDVKLWAEGTRLHYNAPKGAFTPEIRTFIASRKADILNFLQESKFLKIEPVSQNREFPLSFSQERLWFLDQMVKDNTAYNVPIAVRLKGSLDVSALEQGIHEIIKRHKILRTSFPSKDGKPVQVIFDSLRPPIDIVDLQSYQNGERLKRVVDLCTVDVQTPFNLACLPLIRVKLFLLGKTDNVLFINLHHIITDGWSTGIFFREWSNVYQGFLNNTRFPLPDLSIQYADFAFWQREKLNKENLKSSIDYWEKQLLDSPPLLELPYDRPRPPAQTFNGAALHFHIEYSLTRKLNHLARESNSSLFMVLASAFNILLFRYSNQDDILIGIPSANRNRKEVEQLIGFFVNTLVLRTNLSDNPVFTELLNRVRQTTLDAYAHQDLPFEQLVEELHPERVLSHTPYFQVMLAMQNASVDFPNIPDLTLIPLELERSTAKFDLTFEFAETESGLSGLCEYNTDLFDGATITRMVEHFQILLNGVADNPHQKISELPLLNKEEQKKILIDWNATQTEYPDKLCIHQVFEKQASLTPYAVAVEFGDEQVTYSQVNVRANKLAYHLIDMGVGPEVPVGIYLEKSIEMIVSFLAVLKAGGAYIPLDPDYPVERLLFMIGDSGMRLIITQRNVSISLPQNTAHLVCLDNDQDGFSPDRVENPVNTVMHENLAYVIYTSGTTGKPKGVMVSHKGLVNLGGALGRAYYVKADSRFLLFASFSFDASVAEIIMTFYAGATLILGTRSELMPGTDLAQMLDKYKVTHVVLPPSGLTVMPKVTLAALQSLVVAGETCSPVLAEEWANQYRFVNAYGPTEATVCVASYEYKADSAKLPIGRPIDNTRLYILDRNLTPVPVGVSGELYIAGIGLARGYLNLQELTAEKFIPDPFSHDSGSRLYKTGDLASYLSDGNIEILGRLDQQVKIRGFRIEPGEIESVLSEHQGVKECAVTIEQDKSGSNLLSAYYVGFAQSSEIREYLKTKLPDYMIPAFFIIIDRMPLTSNGKIDRNKLLLQERSLIHSETEYIAPDTSTEEMLALIWSEVMDVEVIGSNSDFFDIGGHSLLATQVVSRIRKCFSVDFSVRRLFELPVLSDMSKEIDAKHRESTLKLSPITAVGRKGKLPLSFAQERLWFLDKLIPDSPFYTIPLAIRINGSLKIDVLEKCFNEIIRRHEALRTTFPTINGIAVQAIAPVKHMPLTIKDLNHLSDDMQTKEVERAVFKEFSLAFDLAEDPLIRFSLMKLKPSKHVLLLTMHHIVSDGWSMGIFVKELTELYKAFSKDMKSSLPELPVQYADFAAWQRNALDIEPQLHYWKNQLSELPVLKLPLDYSRPDVQTFRGKTERFEVDHVVTKSLNELAAKSGCSLFMVLLGAFSTLLSRYTNQDDIVIGAPIANRNYPEIESLIGFFVNTQALRCDLSGNPNFLELLSRIKQTAFDAYANQDIPFEKLVEELHPERDMSRNPLMQVTMALQNAPMPSGEVLPGLNISSLDFDPETVRFDIEFHIWEIEGKLKCNFIYSVDLFKNDTVKRMIRHFLTLVNSVVKNPNRKIANLHVLEKEELEQILVTWNDTGLKYNSDTCVHQLFESMAERSPDAQAVVFENRSITYRELNTRANLLSHYLVEHGVKPGKPAAICMERSFDMVVGILAVLKAGGAYVPLDPVYPEERIVFILDDANVKVLLTQRKHANRFSDLKVRVVELDKTSMAQSDDVSADNLNNSNPVSTGVSANAAYIIYTSGTTGIPKGVTITHKNLLSLLYAFEHTTPSSGERIGVSVCTFTFDVSVWEIFSNLCFGGTLHILTQDTFVDPPIFADYLTRNKISSAYIPTALLDSVAECLKETNQRVSLEHLLVGVEPIKQGTLQKYKDLSEKIKIVNGYGPSESTICATFFLFPEKSDEPQSRTPIGKPVSNYQIYILDPSLNPVPIGVNGEICIGGHGLAMGYLNSPCLTAEKFTPNPFSDKPGERIYKTGDMARYLPDGNIEFIGRIDNQMKIRGYRIEAGEIETVLAEHKGVKQNVIIAREDDPGEKRLVAYIVPDFDYLRDETENAEQISRWREVFQNSYSQSNAEDVTFNISGWNNSYTGEQIPDEEMREWVESTVNRILSFHPERVLEIGCGAGLLLSRIAPRCNEYVGTDFSGSALEYAEYLKTKVQGLRGVKLLHRPANNFEGVEPESFDMVILNSVIQYFPNIDYLLEVLDGAIKVIKPGGIIFVGDVKDLRLLKAFHASVQLYKAAPSLEISQLKNRVRQAILQEEEFFVDPAFFYALKKRQPSIAYVRTELKHGQHHNELTKFRYDVMLHINDEPIAVPNIHSINFSDFNGNEFEQNITERRDHIMKVQGILDARKQTDLALVKLLDTLPDTASVSRLKDKLSASVENTMDPETIWNLSNEYFIRVSCADNGSNGVYTVLLRRKKTGNQDSNRGGENVLIEWEQPVINEEKLWKSYANNPLQNKFSRKLTPMLREFISEKLPDYMMPSAFVMLEELPFTSRGKINRAGLPAPDRKRTETEEFVEAGTDTEEILAQIWAEILGVEQVGVHDNYFELGGDSILSIQIISRANQAGLKLTPKDLFTNQTIRELATSAGSIRAIEADQSMVKGTVLLTPIQRWFFEQNFVEPHHFNQSVLLEVPVFNSMIFEKSFRLLLQHHDALRLRFYQDHAGWHEEIDDHDNSVPFSVHDLSGRTFDIQKRDLEIICSELHASLELSKGPLISAAFFDFGNNQSGRLFITIHHLAVDGVSWRILLEDLQSTYEQLSQDKKVKLPKKTSSFKQWSERLAEYARSEELQKEIEYWYKLLKYKKCSLPTDYQGGISSNTIVSRSHVCVTLDGEETQTLLKDIPSVYHTQINDILISALLQSFV